MAKQLKNGILGRKALASTYPTVNNAWLRENSSTFSNSVVKNGILGREAKA